MTINPIKDHKLLQNIEALPEKNLIESTNEDLVTENPIEEPKNAPSLFDLVRDSADIPREARLRGNYLIKTWNLPPYSHIEKKIYDPYGLGWLDICYIITWDTADIPQLGDSLNQKHPGLINPWTPDSFLVDAKVMFWPGIEELYWTFVVNDGLGNVLTREEWA